MQFYKKKLKIEVHINYFIKIKKSKIITPIRIKHCFIINYVKKNIRIKSP